MEPSALARSLSRLSRLHCDPLPSIRDWPATLDQDAWCWSLELSPLHATSRLSAEPEQRLKRLAFFELINFFSLNIHGERALLGGLGENLYGPYASSDWTYLHHFIDEENKHLEYFASFCSRYANKIYPDRKLVFPAEHAPGQASFLFFAKVLIFEEVVDYFNRRLAADERLLPLVRQINRMHHDDEVRHLAFGRSVTTQLFERWAKQWDEATLSSVRAQLATYLDVVMREYTNPLVYLDAELVGVEPGAVSRAHALAREAFAAAAPLRRAATQRVRTFLTKLDAL